MFTTYREVRKEGSEKYTNYDSIFCKATRICICMHRKYSERKHTQNANRGEHRGATTAWQAFYVPTLYFPTSSSS